MIYSWAIPWKMYLCVGEKACDMFTVWSMDLGYEGHCQGWCGWRDRTLFMVYSFVVFIVSFHQRDGDTVCL